MWAIPFPTDMTEMIARAAEAQGNSSLREALEAADSQVHEVRDSLEALDARLPAMQAEGQDTSALEQQIGESLSQIGEMWQQLDYENGIYGANAEQVTPDVADTAAPPPDAPVLIEQMMDQMQELNGTLRDILDEGQEAERDAVDSIGASVDRPASASTGSTPASASQTQPAAARVDEVAAVAQEEIEQQQRSDMETREQDAADAAAQEAAEARDAADVAEIAREEAAADTEERAEQAEEAETRAEDADQTEEAVAPEPAEEIAAAADPLPTTGTSDLEVELASLDDSAQEQVVDAIGEAQDTDTVDELDLDQLQEDAQVAAESREEASEQARLEQSDADAGDYEAARDHSTTRAEDLQVAAERDDAIGETTSQGAFEVSEATDVAADLDAADWAQDGAEDLEAEADDYAGDGDFETAEALGEEAGEAADTAEGYADEADEATDDTSVAYDGD